MQPNKFYKAGIYYTILMAKVMLLHLLTVLQQCHISHHVFHVN